jgi:Ca2+-transporting ATPase
LETAETYTLLSRGLSAEKAREKLHTEGYNQLPSAKRKSFLYTILGVIREPMFILLVVCGTLYMTLGDYREGLMLLGFVFIIMGIEFVQKNKTEKALDALKELASPKALVIRDGIEQRIPGNEVVTGDLIVLQEGDRVPADATVLKSTNLMTDESLLTGESVPVRKSDWNGTEKRTQPGGDDLPFVYSGSMIVQGCGYAEVTHTGQNTEIGKIGKALETIKEESTRLKKEMVTLVKRITIIAAILCCVIVIVYALTRGSLINGLLAGIALAMAVLPEEFPVILAVFMALGAWRMSKIQVLTRVPSSIETLGSATVLCADKTGTLTQNKMSVSQLFTERNYLSVKETNDLNPKFKELIEYGILSSQTKPFDPMEKAITTLRDFCRKGKESIHLDWEMIREYPLSQELLAMSRVFAHHESEEQIIAAKGAPEAIFDLCHLSQQDTMSFAQAARELASAGLRVLGVAKAKLHNSVNNLPCHQHDFDFEFVGLIGLSDPVRDNVRTAVAECYNAGIRTIMITGDYPVTAKNIAREIGLKNPDNCITGQALREMSEEELCRKIKEVNVFARIVPEQKLKIVQALKANQEIVAMTGDGINDAPALKAANIGIAMGMKGTDVARESADLVLLDDNFSSLVNAIKMGRRIFDNLQKAFGYVFAIHVPIAGLALVPILFSNVPIVLWPVHIVFLELIIDPACSIIFEAEKEEPDLMKRPPKGIRESFFGIKKILVSCMQGFGILLTTLFVYFATLQQGYQDGQVRAMAFITLIIANVATILTNRSWSENIFKIIITPNRAVGWVSGSAIIFLIMVLYIPILREAFQFAYIPFMNIIYCSLAGISTIIWFEIFKFVKLCRKL